MRERVIIYSVLPRLWGNLKEQIVANGSIECNGSGKLSMWSEEALAYVKSLGATHIWFVGLIDHATAQGYEGVEADNEAVVKGIAGSPYAIRDYYSIAPELADKVEERLSEFDALVERVHRSGLKLMMDFIPNHVARTYHSTSSPDGVLDLGAGDDTKQAFDPQNNFYYCPDTALILPSGGGYREIPARATGNDCFSPYPSTHDWYETIKLNYGVDYVGGGAKYFDPIPDTWHKMLAILRYWAERGVDGFRCDMAEMVPVEFWAWALPQLKSEYPLIFLAEIYQAGRYADYLRAGFDYLYDKVGVYDTLRAIVRGETSADAFDPVRDAVGEMQERMCYFLENHDEQRFASPYYAGSTLALTPALGVMALSGGQAYLHYFAGELGEAGMDSEGYSGVDGRTSIFDFWSLASLRRLGADYSTKYLLPTERTCLNLHRQILSLASKHPVLSSGAYYGLNYLQAEGYDRHRVLSFVRYTADRFVLLVANFAHEERSVSLRLSPEVFDCLSLAPNTALSVHNLLTDQRQITTLTPLAPYVLQMEALSLRVLEFSRSL